MTNDEKWTETHNGSAAPLMKALFTEHTRRSARRQGYRRYDNNIYSVRNHKLRIDSKTHQAHTSSLSSTY